MITRPLIRLMRAMRGAQPGAMRPNLMVSSTMEINELNEVYNQMVYRQNELTRVVHEKEVMQSRAELKALQSQINPHFLFNTLEAFYWSLEEKGEEELALRVIAMSRLFRYIIPGPHQDEWVTIADELEHAERYLNIMQMRLGEMQWEIRLSEEVRSVPIPKLLIQPLVENAILHGIENTLKPGKVEIRVEPSPLKVVYASRSRIMGRAWMRTSAIHCSSFGRRACCIHQGNGSGADQCASPAESLLWQPTGRCSPACGGERSRERHHHLF